MCFPLVSLQFRSKLATQTSQETEDEADSVDIDMYGEVAWGLVDGPAVGSATATPSRPSLSPDVMPLYFASEAKPFGGQGPGS